MTHDELLEAHFRKVAKERGLPAEYLAWEASMAFEVAYVRFLGDCLGYWGKRLLRPQGEVRIRVARSGALRLGPPRLRRRDRFVFLLHYHGLPEREAPRETSLVLDYGPIQAQVRTDGVALHLAVMPKGEALRPSA